MSQSPKDLEKFIIENSYACPAVDNYGDTHYEVYSIEVDDLRTWMTGHVRVPVEPTEEMIDAGYRMDCIGVDKLRRAYKAMLNASKEE